MYLEHCERFFLILKWNLFFPLLPNFDLSFASWKWSKKSLPFPTCKPFTYLKILHWFFFFTSPLCHHLPSLRLLPSSYGNFFTIWKTFSIWFIINFLSLVDGCSIANFVMIYFSVILWCEDTCDPSIFPFIVVYE